MAEGIAAVLRCRSAILGGAVCKDTIHGGPQAASRFSGYGFVAETVMTLFLAPLVCSVAAIAGVAAGSRRAGTRRVRPLMRR